MLLLIVDVNGDDDDNDDNYDVDDEDDDENGDDSKNNNIDKTCSTSNEQLILNTIKLGNNVSQENEVHEMLFN